MIRGDRPPASGVDRRRDDRRAKARSTEWEDPLTGLPGPAFWQKVLAAESARSRRYRRPATVLLAEVAGLDRIAELWGEDVAAQVSVAIARILHGSSRASDYLARLDTGRFGMILTETDEVAAINFVDRVRGRCADELRGAPEGVAVAFGWASPSSLGALTGAADEAEERLRAEAAVLGTAGSPPATA